MDDPQIAVKLLRPELAEDEGQIQALIAEGERVRVIEHVNVVRVFDTGLDGAGCYLAMERVHGEPLSARLSREGRLPEAEVRRLGAELADGVAAAHACGIIHRDLKPANVMLDGARPKIVDFGIAKCLGTRSAVTTGRMIGTLAYMAPEQLSSGMIAPCTDVWALGVILFEALAGRHPFDNFADGRCPQLFDEPARASAITAVSPQLDEILARCLARDPARRPASAELARFLRGELALDDERITVDAGPLAPVDGDRTTVDVPLALDRATVDAGPLVASRVADDRVDDRTTVVAPMPRRRIAPWLIGGGCVIAAAVALIAIAQRDAEPVSSVARVAGAESPRPPEPEIEIEPTVVGARGRSDSAAVVDKPAQLDPAVVVDSSQSDPAAPVIEVRSKPRGAQVIVDGTLRGVTPLTLEVALPQVVELQRTGYRSVKQRVERAGVVDITLRPLRAAKARTKPLRPTGKEPLD